MCYDIKWNDVFYFFVFWFYLPKAETSIKNYLKNTTNLPKIKYSWGDICKI